MKATNDVFYSLGWQNRVLEGGKLNHWLTGSLPGTATVMIRAHDGRTLVALLNTRIRPSISPLSRAIENVLFLAAEKK